MKRFLLIGVAALCMFTACSENEDFGGVLPNIPDNMEQAFPDPIFREYVMENFDTDHDGKISAAEAEAVTEMDAYNSKSGTISEKTRIASLEGVQYLVNLQSLYCINHRLTSLDVSKNTALT